VTVSLYCCRRNSARSVEDMQRTITELETKLKSESNRLKKKYESEHQDLIIQIDNLNRTNADLAKANKSLATKLRVASTSLFLNRISEWKLEFKTTTSG